MERAELRNAYKVIKGNEVLTDINLIFEKGKIYGLTGRNGSGKTMVLRLLAGIMKPTNGKVFYDGKDINDDNYVKPDIGLVIENIGVYSEFTGRKNLELLAGIRGRIGHKEVDNAIRRVGLEPDNNKPVKKYSLGMKKRIVIAQAIMEEPEILILDEPTNGLDKDGVELFRKIIVEERDRGAVIVIASHNNEDMEGLFDVVYEIDNGKLVTE